MRYLFTILILSFLFSSCTTKGKEKSEAAEGAEVSESLFIDKNLEVVISEDAETHSNSFSQPDISGTIGVVVLKLWEDEENPPPPPVAIEMQFLNDDGTEWLAFSFGDDDNYEEEYRKFMSKMEQGFDPRMIHFEYQILVMDCVAEDASYYTVIVDKHTRDTKRLKKQEGLRLQTWEQHVLSALIGLDETKLRDGVDGKHVVLSGKEDAYTGIEIDGDWMKVSPVVFDDETPQETAWIKWREGERLLVDLHYMF